MYHFKKYPMTLTNKRGKTYQVYIGFVDQLTWVIVPNKIKDSRIQVSETLSIGFSEKHKFCVAKVDLLFVMNHMNNTLLEINTWEGELCDKLEER